MRRHSYGRRHRLGLIVNLVRCSLLSKMSVTVSRCLGRDAVKAGGGRRGGGGLATLPRVGVCHPLPHLDRATRCYLC